MPRRSWPGWPVARCSSSRIRPATAGMRCTASCASSPSARLAASRGRGPRGPGARGRLVRGRGSARGCARRQAAGRRSGGAWRRSCRRTPRPSSLGGATRKVIEATAGVPWPTGAPAWSGRPARRSSSAASGVQAYAAFDRAAGKRGHLDAATAWRMGLVHGLRGAYAEALRSTPRPSSTARSPRTRRCSTHGSPRPTTTAATSRPAAKPRSAPCTGADRRATTGPSRRRTPLADEPRPVRPARAGSPGFESALAAAERAGDMLQIVRIRTAHRGRSPSSPGGSQEALDVLDGAVRIAETVGFAAFQARAPGQSRAGPSRASAGSRRPSPTSPRHATSTSASARPRSPTRSPARARSMPCAATCSWAAAPSSAPSGRRPMPADHHALAPACMGLAGAIALDDPERGPPASSRGPSSSGPSSIRSTCASAPPGWRSRWATRRQAAAHAADRRHGGRRAPRRPGPGRRPGAPGARRPGTGRGPSAGRGRRRHLGAGPGAFRHRPQPPRLRPVVPAAGGPGGCRRGARPASARSGPAGACRRGGAASTSWTGPPGRPWPIGSLGSLPRGPRRRGRAGDRLAVEEGARPAQDPRRPARSPDHARDVLRAALARRGPGAAGQSPVRRPGHGPLRPRPGATLPGRVLRRRRQEPRWPWTWSTSTSTSRGSSTAPPPPRGRPGTVTAPRPAASWRRPRRCTAATSSRRTRTRTGPSRPGRRPRRRTSGSPGSSRRRRQRPATRTWPPATTCASWSATPYDESAHLGLVDALRAAGRHGEARRRYGVLRRQDGGDRRRGRALPERARCDDRPAADPLVSSGLTGVVIRPARGGGVPPHG